MSFDFDGAFSGEVYYVKVLRTASGSNTGMFFDSLAGISVPEPATLAMLALGAAAMFRRKK